MQAKDAAKDTPEQPSIWEQDTLTGDWGGARTALKDKGIDFTLNYINEMFGVLSGGLKRQRATKAASDFSVDADLQKLLGWSGATTHVTVYQIHNSGHNTSSTIPARIADPSNIDALRTTRLFTAWFRAECFGEPILVARRPDRRRRRPSSPADTAGHLINGNFGWATNLGADMLQRRTRLSARQRPAYASRSSRPTSSLSSRRRFSGDPAGRNCPLDEQSAGLQPARH